jgi:ABC-type antimicrobial peptide transport system ATPase subunit
VISDRHNGLRLNNRQRIANAREKPIKANKNQAVDDAEGLFLRSGSPQNVYLLPQHPNFHLKRYPRPNRSATIQTMSLTRSLIPQQHRPILDQLLVRLSLR